MQPGKRTAQETSVTNANHRASAGTVQTRQVRCCVTPFTFCKTVLTSVFLTFTVFFSCLFKYLTLKNESYDKMAVKCVWCKESSVRICWGSLVSDKTLWVWSDWLACTRFQVQRSCKATLMAHGIAVFFTNIFYCISDNRELLYTYFKITIGTTWSNHP